MFSGIYFETDNITSFSVTKHPDFDAPLVGLHWQILFEKQSAFEGNHSVINADLFSRLIVFLEVCNLNQLSDLEEWIITWLAPGWGSGSVSDMEVLVKFVKPGPAHDATDPRIVDQ